MNHSNRSAHFARRFLLRRGAACCARPSNLHENVHYLSIGVARVHDFSRDDGTSMNKIAKAILWIAISLAGATALSVIAFERKEPLNAVWFIVAAVATYMVAYRFYSKFIAAKVLGLDESRATPAERRKTAKISSPPTNGS